VAWGSNSKAQDTRLHPLLSATVGSTVLPRDHAAEALRDIGVEYCWQSRGIAQNLWNVHTGICTVPEAVLTGYIWSDLKKKILKY
jgi:hypothetical protein